MDRNNLQASITVRRRPDDGKDGKTPYIGANGNWWVWDSSQNKYVDSGDKAQGSDGRSPVISGGTWHVWENGGWTDTGIKAQGQDAVSLVMSPSGHTFKTDKNGSAIPRTIYCSITATRGGSSLTVAASQIAIGGFVPYGMIVTKYTNQISIRVTSEFQPIREGMDIYVTIGSVSYLLVFLWDAVKDGEDGDDGVTTQTVYMRNNSATAYPTMPSGSNLNGWTEQRQPPTAAYQYEWTTQRSGNSKDGWSAWSSPVVINRWVTDGSGVDIIYVRRSSSTPPSRPVGDNPVGWSRTLLEPTSSERYTYASIREGNTGNYSIWSLPYVYLKWVDDGAPGLPGQIPVTKEWVAGDTHRNNDRYVDFIYVRGQDAQTSYWYQRSLKGDLIAGAPPGGGTTPTGYERIDWLKTLAVQVFIAEEANLAGFIFKEGKLISQVGLNTAGDSIKLGEYVQFQFGIYNSTTPPASNWSGWVNIPPTTTGNYLWIRYKITSESVWAVKRVTGTDPDFTVQFGTLKDGTFFNPPYQAGRNWMKMSDGRVYAITEELALGDYDPNLWLDGKTGEIIAKNGYFGGNLRIRHIGGGETRIDHDGIRIFNDSGIQNIRFGIKNGFAVMEYYDNSGNFLYDLGPGGISTIAVREERWVPVNLVYLGSFIDDVLDDFNEMEIFKNHFLQTSATHYRYESKMVAGVLEDPLNDGRIYKYNYKSGGFLPDGIYVNKRMKSPLQYPTGNTNQRIYPPRMYSGNEPVYDRPILYSDTMIRYVAGKFFETYLIYWNDSINPI